MPSLALRGSTSLAEQLLARVYELNAVAFILELPWRVELHPTTLLLGALRESRGETGAALMR